MTTGISIAIPLGFLILAGMLAWYLAHTKGHWAAKVFLTIIVAFYSIEVWSALDSYLGWAAREPMPQRALLVSAMVREPSPAKRDRGAIFLWVVPLGQDDPGPFAYDSVSGEPRAHRLPYSRAMHKQTAEAMQAMRQSGRPILIERQSRPDEREGSDGGHSTFNDDSDTGFRMRELPPPSLPDKAPQGP